MKEIPLVDLRAQMPGLEEEVWAGLGRVMEKTSFILGQEVSAFEEDFARYVGVEHCVGVGNGTDALELALRALGVGQGDEVILPANGFVASALAVVRAGAMPVLVDCDPLYLLMDLGQVEEKLSERTRAVMPVHLYGQMVPLEELCALADRAAVAVVEDAAQAHGARRHGKAAASLGQAAGTSFYPSKNLGAFGDGGAVLTDSNQVAKRVRLLRNYGSEVKHHHPQLGFNSRLDSLQAVVLSIKLKHLDEWNRRRGEAARRYDRLLADIPDVELPATLSGNQHVWHLYVVRLPGRGRVQERLRDKGIQTGIHYPVPLHLQGAFSFLGHGRGDFPQAERAADRILSLPLYPEITPEQQERVVDALKQALV